MYYFSECRAPLDIALIIDSSGSINEVTVNWPTVIDFLIRLVNQFDIGVDGVHIGAVQFSDRERLEWTLDQYLDRDSLIRAINQIQYLGGRTNLAGGLELANTQIFNARGDRPNVPNVALVITDGLPNERESETIPQATNLKRSVQLLVAVGVTNAVDFVLLEQIASSPQDVIRVDDFNALVTDLARIVSTVCYNPVPPPLPPVVVPGPAPRG